MNAATGGTSDRDDEVGRGAQDEVPVFDGMQDRAAARQGDGWDGDDWTEADDDAEDAELSRLVRPYTLTRGRTRHAEGAAFDVIAQIIAVDRTDLPESDATERADGPEYQAILDLVLERPLSVAEVAAGTDLPLGVARILLGDLLEADLIRVSRPVPTAELPDSSVLRDVIRGLRAL